MKQVMRCLSVGMMSVLMCSQIFSVKQGVEESASLYRTDVKEIDEKLTVVSEGYCKLEKIWHEIVHNDKQGDKEETFKRVCEFLKEGRSQETSLKSARKILMTPERVSKHPGIINFLNAMESSLQKDMQEMSMLQGVLLIYLRIPRMVDIPVVLSGEGGKTKVCITARTDKDNFFPEGLYFLYNPSVHASRCSG